MNKWLKEGIWIVALIVLPLIALSFYSSRDGIILDINVHDTYFVLDVFTMYALLSLLLWFPVYFIRVLLAAFANKPMNIVFILVTFCIAVFLTQLISLLEAVSAPGWAIYPPLSSPPQKIPVSEPEIDTVYLAFVQGFMILLIAFTAYRTGQNPKRS